MYDPLPSLQKDVSKGVGDNLGTLPKVNQWFNKIDCLYQSGPLQFVKNWGGDPKTRRAKH